MTLTEVFRELDGRLTDSMREKVGRDDFSLRECYASSQDEGDRYTYGGVFHDHTCEDPSVFSFYTYGHIDGDGVCASARVAANGLVVDEDSIFEVRQMFDDRYEAIALRGHVKPLIVTRPGEQWS